MGLGDIGLKPAPALLPGSGDARAALGHIPQLPSLPASCTSWHRPLVINEAVGPQIKASNEAVRPQINASTALYVAASY